MSLEQMQAWLFGVAVVSGALWAALLFLAIAVRRLGMAR